MGDQRYNRAIAEITRGFITEFGDVHVFGWQAAKTKKGGTKAVGTGEDAGKRPKYGKAAQAALAGGNGGGDKPQPKKSGGHDEAIKAVKDLYAGALNPDVAGKDLRQQAINAVSHLSTADVMKVHAGLGYQAKPKSRAAAIAAIGQHVAGRRGAYDRAQVAAEGPEEDYTRPMGKIKPISPVETQSLDKHQTADLKRYGPRMAKVLRGAAEAVRGLFTLGGLAGGAYLGAGVGGVLGGPLGMALGTAIGGGLGGLGGSKVKLPGVLNDAEAGKIDATGPETYRSPVPRVRALARRAARKVVPQIAGAAGLPAAAAGLGTSALAATAIGIPGMLLSHATGDGESLMNAVGAPAEMGMRVPGAIAEATRLRMATSLAAKRKLARGIAGNRYSEFAELPPNIVSILKVRLKIAARKAGVALPEIPDEVVQKAIEMASQDASVDAMSESLGRMWS